MNDIGHCHQAKFIEVLVSLDGTFWHCSSERIEETLQLKTTNNSEKILWSTEVETTCIVKQNKGTNLLEVSFQDSWSKNSNIYFAQRNNQSLHVVFQIAHQLPSLKQLIDVEFPH